MAYQTRSTRTEALLLAELSQAGLRVERVDPAEQLPDFRVCGYACCFRSARSRLSVRPAFARVALRGRLQ